MQQGDRIKKFTKDFTLFSLRKEKSSQKRNEKLLKLLRFFLFGSFFFVFANKEKEQFI